MIIEVSRSALTAYLRAGPVEALIDLDDTTMTSVCWRGRTVWPADARRYHEEEDDGGRPRPTLDAVELELAVADEAFKRDERGRKWWRRALRGRVRGSVNGP